MNLDQHSDILNAYLSRLAMTDLRQILAAIEDCQHAQLNLGTSSQLSYQDALREVVRAAVESLIQHDRDLIERRLSRAMEESQ